MTCGPHAPRRTLGHLSLWLAAVGLALAAAPAISSEPATTGGVTPQLHPATPGLSGHPRLPTRAPVLVRPGQRHAIVGPGSRPRLLPAMRPEQVRGVTPKLPGMNSSPDRGTAERLAQAAAERDAMLQRGLTVQEAERRRVTVSTTPGFNAADYRDNPAGFREAVIRRATEISTSAAQTVCPPPTPPAQGLTPRRIGRGWGERLVRPMDGVYLPAQADDELVREQYEAAMGLESRASAAQDASAQPTPRTAVELAHEALRRGEVEAAVRMFEAHLKESPDDWASARLLGVALIEAGRPSDGATLMRFAYVQRPALAGEPIEMGFWPSEPRRAVNRRFREVLREAVRHASRSNSASSWVAVTALLQAEGRNRPAAVNLAKAVGAGLEEPVAEAFRKALGFGEDGVPLARR